MKTHKLFYILFFLLQMVACKSFVEVDPPQNLVISRSVFTTDETAVAALVGIYAQMSKDAFTTAISQTSGLAGDELKNYSGDPTVVQMYQNVPQSQDAYSNKLWNLSYSYIYQANAILEGCGESVSLSPTVKKQITAEAYFVRAFCYYYLVNFYGDVPLLLSTDYSKNAVAGRTLTLEVYKQIVSDLQLAADNLSADYVDASGKGVSQQRVRPNRYAALALLARVQLSSGNPSSALAISRQVIDQSTLYDTVGLSSVFLNNNKEAIWQLQMTTPPPTSNLSTWEASNYILTARPATAGSSRSNTVSQNLLDAFEPGDKRLPGWVGTFTDVTVTPAVGYRFPNKYKVLSAAQPTERSTVLRLAEQYLIHAEASAQLTDLDQANKDLNLVRKRAGLSPVSITDKEVMLTALLHERQVEFFTEWGHRWLDLKRSGKIATVMNTVLPQKGGGNWNAGMAFWPIPQTEIDNNPSLSSTHTFN